MRFRGRDSNDHKSTLRTVNGVRIRCADNGGARKPTILLFDASLDDYREMDPFVSEEAPTEYASIIVNSIEGGAS
jgi:hypothetical protein